jgi:hypothetical protein
MGQMFTFEYCRAKAEFYALQLSNALSVEQRQKLQLLHRSYTLLAKNAAFWAGTEQVAEAVELRPKRRSKTRQAA